VEVVTPHPDEVDYIHTTYLQLVSAGAGLASHRDGLSQLAHKLVERDRVQAVILAGTELALLFGEGTTDFPNINGARLHLNAIVRRAID
jgi:aspartate racemase